VEQEPEDFLHAALPSRLPGRRRLGVQDAVVAGEHRVLVLPCEGGALEPERGSEYPLNVVGYINGALPRRARRLCGELVQERHLVHGPRVHEEEDGVHGFPPARRRRVEEPHAVVHRHGHDPVAELREELGEAEQEGLPARGALGAHGHVATGQLGAHACRVHFPVSRQAHRRDRGEDLGEAGDGVCHGGHAAPEHGGQHHGVHERAVRADEEDPRGRRADVRGVAGPDWGRRAAVNDHGAAEDRRDVGDAPDGNHEADGDADEGDQHAERQPEEDDEGHEWRGPAHEATVVEDDRPERWGGVHPVVSSERRADLLLHA
jgi:hypothetical protein